MIAIAMTDGKGDSRWRWRCPTAVTGSDDQWQRHMAVIATAKEIRATVDGGLIAVAIMAMAVAVVSDGGRRQLKQLTQATIDSDGTVAVAISMQSGGGGN